MKKIYFVLLCALLVIAVNVGLNIPLRVAIAINSILILIEIIKEIRGFCNGREKKKD